jgi:hypothetical protein
VLSVRNGRTAADNKLKSSGLTPNELNKRYISEMLVAECLSGNTTKCQAGILEQALYKPNRSQRLYMKM